MSATKSRALVLSISLALGLQVVACAHGKYGPSAASSRVSRGPRTLTQLTVEERRATLARAQAWQPIETRSLNLLTGPSGPGSYGPDASVPCRFIFPNGPLGGKSQKFLCQVAKDDVVKVKYGRTNGEVYAVVAASRLLWALGFESSRWYPVRVDCQDCPENPWLASRTDWFKGRPRFTAERTFDLAAIERPLEGKAIETPGFQGWSWLELDAVNVEAGGAPRSHLDALKLLAVFLQHNDTKPEQQELICPSDSIRRDAQGNERCTNPRLVLTDVGATFSEGSFWRVGKMNLEKWRDASIWEGQVGCIGNVEKFLNGNLNHPLISESGRAFLAGRLALLTDQQIHDLFAVARVDRQGQQIRDDRGALRAVTVDDWVTVFKNKRAEIANMRCRA